MNIYKWFVELLAKSSKVNERLKTIHEAFHVEIYFKLLNMPISYILELGSSVAKSAKISTILYYFVPKIKKKH